MCFECNRGMGITHAMDYKRDRYHNIFEQKKIIEEEEEEEVKSDIDSDEE